MVLSWEFFGFIVFILLKPGVNVLSEGALAGPVWREVLGEGDGQFFPLTSQSVCLVTQQKYMPQLDLGFHQQKVGGTGSLL